MMKDDRYAPKASMADTNEQFEPPPGPPPLLSSRQLQELAYQGHLSWTLPLHLQDVLTSLDEASQAFFRHDPPLKAMAYPNNHGTELGYYVVEGEKEHLTLRHSQRPLDVSEAVAQTCENIDRHAQELWQITARLMHRVLMNVSSLTGIDPMAWEPVLDGCLDMPPDFARTTPSLLRLFRYEPDKGIAGEHTDNGLLTLCVGSEKGLQVWQRHGAVDLPHEHQAEQGESNSVERSGHWEDVQGPILLAGTTLRLLTTDRIAAGRHRVISNPKGRRSIVFALRPSVRHHLDLAPFGGEGTWDMALLWKRITSDRVNVNAIQSLRQEQARKQDEAKKKQIPRAGNHAAMIIEAGARG